MRYFGFVFLLFLTSICLAQETYHDEGFGFTIKAPSGWQLRLEDEWPDKIRNYLKKRYESKTVAILNQLDAETMEAPCIRIRGKFLKKTTTSEAIATIKAKGKEQLVSAASLTLMYVLGREYKQYNQVDTSYNYN